MNPFFDSNILIYAYSTDIRRHRAMTLVAAGGIISTQVLNEFTNVLRRKQKQDWPIIEAAVGSVRAHFPEIIPITVGIHAGALRLARDHGFAFYDALIVAAALEASCDTLYSEDMQHGRSLGGITIVNPFAATSR